MQVKKVLSKLSIPKNNVFLLRLSQGWGSGRQMGVVSAEIVQLFLDNSNEKQTQKYL